MNHLLRQDAVAEYVNYLRGKTEQEKTKQTKPSTTKQTNKTVLILHTQAFLWSSKNCKALLTVEKKAFADSVWQVDFETQVKGRTHQ